MLHSMQEPPNHTTAHLNSTGSRWWWLAAAVFFVAGALLRFDDIALLPLADDEYYVARSVENILRSGWPEYLCGGYYPRGLLFQYAAAALTLAGTPLEFAARYIASFSSLLALPAAFLVARRLGGNLLGILVLAWLSLSLWEIDGAQFGRMYAPFQAIFCWYVWFYLRLTVDRDRSAAVPLLFLTIGGVLTWEGGVLLALTNLLAPFFDDRKGHIDWRDMPFLTASALLGVAAFLFATTDFRNLDPALVYPPGIDAIDTIVTPGWREVATMIGPLQRGAWLWAAAAIVPLAVSTLALRWLWREFRGRWMAGAGLAMALVAAAFHQFATSGLILAALAVMGLIEWRELGARLARPYVLSLVLWFAGWLAYATLAAGWSEGADTSVISQVPFLRGLYSLIRFPDFLLELVLPWNRAAPRLGAAIGLALVLGTLLAGWRRQNLDANLRVSLCLLLVLLGAAAASDPPRHETRYVFFLYPIAITVLLALLASAVAVLTKRRQSAVAAVLVTILLFSVTEDTGIRERSGATSGMTRSLIAPAAGKGHLVGRSDSRGIASWLAANVRPRQDLVINAAPGVDFYYRSFDFAYIDWTQQRFLAYSCERGNRERWGNLHLLYTGEKLKQAVASRERSLIVATAAQAQELQQGALSGFASTVAFLSADSELLVLEIRRIPS